jgi:(2Fe-2S) ferredoxin
MLPAPATGVRVQHHLLLCATPSKALCCPDPAIGAASWDTLKRLVRELGLEEPSRPEGVVWRTKADCLRVCRDGPVLLIWPDGVIYGRVTPERIERILREHVIGGTPVKAWILDHTMLNPRPDPERCAAGEAHSSPP